MKRAVVISLVVTALLIAGLIVIGRPVRWPPVETLPYQGEAAALSSAGMPAGHSSAALGRLVREPQNTWSSLAFVVGGSVLIAVAATRITRHLGSALIAVGVGSFLYHASAAVALRHLDVGAMFWLYLLTLALCVAVVVPRWQPRMQARAHMLSVAALLGAIGLAVARTLAAVGAPRLLHAATALTVAAVILTLARVAWRRETLGAALQLLGIVTLFGIAAACQTGDRPGESLYRPTAYIQAHAVWHVLAATALVWAACVLDRAASASPTRVPPPPNLP